MPPIEDNISEICRLLGNIDQLIITTHNLIIARITFSQLGQITDAREQYACYVIIYAGAHQTSNRLDEN
jgi:hypothetical protein